MYISPVFSCRVTYTQRGYDTSIVISYLVHHSDTPFDASSPDTGCVSSVYKPQLVKINWPLAIMGLWA